MKLTKKQRERLSAHPEVTEIDLFGEPQNFLLTVKAASYLRAEHGIEVVPILIDFVNRIGGGWFGAADDLELGTDKAKEVLDSALKTGDLERLSMLVYWGLVTFEEDLTLDDVQLFLTPTTIIRLFSDLMVSFASYATDTPLDEIAEESGEEGDDSGN